jgi:hypothetical protein
VAAWLYPTCSQFAVVMDKVAAAVEDLRHSLPRAVVVAAAFLVGIDIESEH